MEEFSQAEIARVEGAFGGGTTDVGAVMCPRCGNSPLEVAATPGKTTVDLRCAECGGFGPAPRSRWRRPGRRMTGGPDAFTAEDLAAIAAEHERTAEEIGHWTPP